MKYNIKLCIACVLVVITTFTAASSSTADQNNPKNIGLGLYIMDQVATFVASKMNNDRQQPNDWLPITTRSINDTGLLETTTRKILQIETAAPNSYKPVFLGRRYPNNRDLVIVVLHPNQYLSFKIDHRTNDVQFLTGKSLADADILDDALSMIKQHRSCIQAGMD